MPTILFCNDKQVTYLHRQHIHFQHYTHLLREDKRKKIIIILNYPFYLLGNDKNKKSTPTGALYYHFSLLPLFAFAKIRKK